VKLFRLSGFYYQRYPKLGPILYVASIQYFLAQAVVAQDWSPPYSIARDTISDLGNTRCGTFNARFVCSPLHSVMNASFIVLGITMILGSLLIIHQFSRSRRATFGLASMAISGAGVIMVGLFPENTVPALHGIGAATPFLLGNIAVIVLGFSLNLPGPLRFYSLLSGILALVALGCYASSHYLGLGEGGIERVVAYPQTAWLIVVGFYVLLRNPVRKASESRIYDATSG
jgi:hypothetical membrane protein